MSGVVIPTLDDLEVLVDRVDQLTETVGVLADLVRNATNPPLMMKLAAASAYCGLPETTLSKLIRAGDLVWHEVEGSKRLSRDDLDALIAARTASSASQPAPLRVVGT